MVEEECLAMKVEVVEEVVGDVVEELLEEVVEVEDLYILHNSNLMVV